MCVYVFLPNFIGGKNLIKILDKYKKLEQYRKQFRNPRRNTLPEPGENFQDILRQKSKIEINN